jgi:hypothetical protein
MSGQTIGILLGSLLLNCSVIGVAWGQAPSSQSVPELEAKPIGKVIEIAGAVTIEHTSAVLLQAKLPASGGAKVDDPVFQGDVVQTGPDGKLGLALNDGTSFKVSANARMELNEFIYDPKGNSNSTAFNLTKGSFTFLAGAIAKTGNMRIETPVATMGIRGTAPHVEILENGTVKFSTLIEENKSAKDSVVKPRQRTTPVQRKAQAPLSAPPVPKPKVDEKKFKICVGC